MRKQILKHPICQYFCWNGHGSGKLFLEGIQFAENYNLVYVSKGTFWKSKYLHRLIFMHPALCLTWSHYTSAVQYSILKSAKNLSSFSIWWPSTQAFSLSSNVIVTSFRTFHDGQNWKLWNNGGSVYYPLYLQPDLSEDWSAPCSLERWKISPQFSSKIKCSGDVRNNHCLSRTESMEIHSGRVLVEMI